VPGKIVNGRAAFGRASVPACADPAARGRRPVAGLKSSASVAIREAAPKLRINFSIIRRKLKVDLATMWDGAS